jgi:hypothetical protein
MSSEKMPFYAKVFLNLLRMTEMSTFLLFRASAINRDHELKSESSHPQAMMWLGRMQSI